MPRTSRLTGDTISVFAAALLAAIASTAGEAAPRARDAVKLNHDRQHVVLGDHADARHDRAPCPSGGVPG